MAFAPDSTLVAERVPSPNHGERRGGAAVDMLVLHYTGMLTAEAAVKRLCAEGSEVSAHYVVLEEGRILQCVAEERRAWHAGISSWDGITDINSSSLGIEIANPGHDHGYPDFSAPQINAVIALCRDILTRHRVPAHRVLAHSDVAPKRKCDPGEKFPWALLHAAGIGRWVAPAPVEFPGAKLGRGNAGPTVERLQRALARYGYGIEASGSYDQATQAVVAAFQRHFRPALIDGRADASTRDTLGRLLKSRELDATV